MSQLPIIVSEEVKPKKLGIQIYSAIYRWQEKNFVDLSTGKKVPSLLWQFVGLNRLNGCYNIGRRITGTRKREYGFSAIASALTALGIPISTEEVKKLIENAIKSGANHCKFVLKSDLVPTSPSRYSGKNEWVLVQNVPTLDEVYESINKALKATGSTLRVKAGLQYRLVE